MVGDWGLGTGSKETIRLLLQTDSPTHRPGFVVRRSSFFVWLSVSHDMVSVFVSVLSGQCVFVCGECVGFQGSNHFLAGLPEVGS